MSTAQSRLDHAAHYIDGEWQPSSDGGQADVINPATGEPVGRVALATPDDIDRAVRAARASFERGDWRDRSPMERAAVIRLAADILDSRKEELVDLLATELGCPRWFSEKAQVPRPIKILRGFADMSETHVWEEERSDGALRSLVYRHPVGVVGAITPWNSPLNSPVIKIAPAIAAGCSIVLKPATLTPLTGLVLIEALEEAGLPPGVVNYVPGNSDAGRHLAAHPDIDKIAFTGSTAAGRAIMAACAERIARVTLELGGKSAAIMLPDCDAQTYASGVLRMGMLLNTGQVCHCQSRLLVPRSRYAEVAEAVTEAARAAKVGDPFDPETMVGPLVSDVQRARVESYIESGVAQGATISTGGGRPDHLDRGWYVEPTVFTNATNDMTISQEEIFGPVVTLIPYGDEREAVRIANDTIYGLSGSVWTNDEEHALEIAQRLRTGTVSINGRPQADGTPFGGFRQSGLGREGSREGLDEYTELQSIALGR